MAWYLVKHGKNFTLPWYLLPITSVFRLHLHDYVQLCGFDFVIYIYFLTFHLVGQKETRGLNGNQCRHHYV
jgi:hypothetical protein